MAYLDGIDISHWQKGLNVKKVDADFIILKATQGVNYKDPCFDQWAKEVLDSGKKLGIYHFADGETSGAEEAFYFWRVVQKYNGKAIFVLDWEANALKKGVSYARAFLDNFYKVSGKRALIYTSRSVTTAYNWSSVAKNYKLWVAGYPSSSTTKYYHPSQYPNLGAWSKAIIRQYSDKGRVEGYSGNLDIDCFYGSKADWDKIAGTKVVTTTTIKKEEPKKTTTATTAKKTTTVKKTTTTSKKTTTTKKSIDTLAREVIAGKWGTGDSRKSKIKKAGYDYNQVQARVNKYNSVAKDVIKGKYGTGAIRTSNLKKAGYDPATVQKLVNQLL